MQPSFGSQHFLDIPGLISLVLDSTDWTLLKTNIEEEQEVKWHVSQDSFLRWIFSCSSAHSQYSLPNNYCSNKARNLISWHPLDFG